MTKYFFSIKNKFYIFTMLYLVWGLIKLKKILVYLCILLAFSKPELVSLLTYQIYNLMNMYCIYKYKIQTCQNKFVGVYMFIFRHFSYKFIRYIITTYY